MPRFFCENFNADTPISGEDGIHIAKSLRMRVGEELTVCDTKGTDYLCRIREIVNTDVYLDIINSAPNDTEPDIKVTLFQCVPKGDKLETITQKCVELGVTEIIPVLSERSVSRPDSKSAAKKQVRLQKIANEAAGQSRRGILPKVGEMITMKECISKLKDFDTSLFLYELGGNPMGDVISDNSKNISVIVGPEGGFSPDEAKLIQQAGAKAITLGKRILRTETAPITALSCIMLLTGNLN